MCLLWKTWTEKSDQTEPHVDWVHLIAEARRNPRIARYQDEERQGMLLLHLVCALKPPLRVVNEVLRINPQAVSHKSMSGELLPLHIAVGRNADVSVVRLLIQQDQKSLLTPDNNGHTALAWACRDDVSKDLVRLILEFNPSLAHRRTGKLGSPLEFVYRQRHFYQTAPPGNEIPEWDENQWTKVTYLLWAAHYGTIIKYRNGHKFSTLHAALALSSPSHIIEDTTRFCAKHVCGIRDYQGNYPLHYAARTSNASRRVLVQLLKHFPPAASIRDSQGRLPLHEALKQGRTWEEGIKELYRMHPAAIAEKDVEMSLFPAHLAAMVGDLTTIFVLIRENPQQVIHS